MITRLACIPLIAAVLLVTGCHSHHRGHDGGWRDNDRSEHRHKRQHRHDHGDKDYRYDDRNYR